MALRRLLNYLRSHRKRSCLSQDDVAYLLGVQSGAKICRYERSTRDPSLAAALALEAVFRKPVAKLFPALYRQIEEEVRLRAKRLLAKEAPAKAKAWESRRREILEAIINESFSSPS